ncbi:sodium:solute symporter family protein [Shumkonia mesophila]|uniref:sodium:solute symporter family protein n=1 Tax=Shumkonia mesophila TaxID=2838854 RepID=UPI0029349D74|nr:sodium:solute symporter family protein [Shumkonia mesophila]
MAISSTIDSKKGGFLGNLGKIYGGYAGAFIGFTLVLAVLEQMGLGSKIIGYAFMFLTIAVYAYIGFLSRTMELSEYYVAGRAVPALYNGMATGADWMSAASFISMAGGLYLGGYSGLGYVLGWTGGYVLVAVLLAPYLRKFGQFTVPDFLGVRYEGNTARFIGVVVLFSASFTYIVAQTYGIGIITSRFLGIPFEIAIFAGLLGILVCSMLGGMRAVTWTQVAQYIILIIAYLVPVVWLSTKLYGIPIPELTYGQALTQIAELEKQLGIVKPHAAAFVDAAGQFSWSEFNNFWSLVLCLMVGTASLPHILMRYFTTPNVREARLSVAWSIFFIFLLYFTAPAYAAFAKLEVYSNVIGQPIASLPAWVQNWSQVGGLLTLKDANADGILQLQELVINQDIIVLSMPEIAGLPYVISGLVAAGGLAAALSTADGLLLAIANALSHDIYYKMLNPKASTARRLIVARVLLVGVALLAAAVAGTRPSGIIQMVAWAFSLAAAGLFAPLVLGIWWKRTSSTGAILGMLSGFGVCLYYLIATRYFDMPLWFGIRNISSALFGLPVAFIVTWLVSLVTPAPSRQMQEFVDSIRTPRGDVAWAGKVHE